MTKILVIEDEKLVRENIIDLLAAEDFDTIAAANGRIGLDLALSQTPDLILCDLMMPEVDGYGVLTTLREKAITASIPFIFLTAKSARTDFRQGMDLGADDYLTKPFTRTELLNAIASRLTKQASLAKQVSTKFDVQTFSPKQQMIEMFLRRAIEREEFEQFLVYYQPIVDIHSGRIIGAESLLRWQHPELGMVTPTELIPLAESTGLILPISDWVLKNVCQQMKLWHNQGFTDLRIAVNISANQLKQPNFTEKILHLLLVNNLVPDCLVLELTENIIRPDINQAISTMNEIHSYGVKIAIDDFGAGYTSLIYLKQLPIHTLKIDRYFIQCIANDLQKAIITTALIQMAHNLNLHIVAEGVETEQELAFLRQHKCDAIQGFFFSHPLPATEFEKILVAKKRLNMSTV
ncbi:diguanylate cyclase [Brasilonema octagenarum UFV-E1]|uniref:Diguanylate cyclase n=1 Tax=Brasilonema sennae CENA114 TaxID=415709 RepID=A0A856MNR4_9CYAN|nr:EAL domain-containing response regulator [Brasilonema sennae]QDL11730.1 diguanylate cyclase [Brasilonema sennae CENA114]QDL18111.1 diguanylate cyclase [Brasilonema octagenarum UFV-E1]